MEDKNLKEISIVGFEEIELTSKGITDAKITDILNKSKMEVINNVDVNIVKKNMIDTLDGILEVFESEQLENRNFSIDEIEVALNVGCEGTVSILSTVSAQTNMQSSIVVKLKRRMT